MITYLFPGQGSQKQGMGADVFGSYVGLVQQADDALGYSIKDLCLSASDEELSRTNYAQPAIYVVNALHYLSQIEHIGKQPDFVAGHSLGEYNALFAAGAFDFVTGVKLVQKRGELMAKAENGGMAAVIGLNALQIESILESNGLGNIDIANINTPEQIVISGKKEDIDSAQKPLEQGGARMYIKLNVGGAFHSRYMQDAADEFKDFLSDFEFERGLRIPVIANATAVPYRDDSIHDNLAAQIRMPVKWLQSIVHLYRQGNMLFKEIGNSNILTNMLRKIEPAVA